jgi:4-carboxymuconolactone decarboxylase
MRRSALLVMTILTMAAGWVAIIATGPHAMSKEPRFTQLTMDQLTDQQKPLGEQIMKVSSVGIGGPYNPLLRSPVLGQRMFDLLHYLRWETSVPLKLNEFAILIIGGVARARTARHQGWAVAGNRSRTQGQQAAVEHAGAGIGGL